MKKKVYHYLINVYFSEEDNFFVAEVPELPGCASHGKTYESAIKHAQGAIETWIEGAKESGYKIPEPISTKKYSGKFVARVGAKIHRELSLKAEARGKSLNGIVKEILETAI